MSVCPPREAEEPVRATRSETGSPRNRRRGRELVTERVFRPLALPLVGVFAAARVPPAAVVVANAAAGLAAAVEIASGRLVLAALLLQLKTLLDNADGQLARATGRGTVLGRYLDTESDLVVNAALFAALAAATEAPLLALVAFAALTLVLTTDFNADVLYRRAHGETVVTQPSAECEGRAAQVLARVYGVVFGPQDRLLQGLSRRRLERLLSDTPDPERRRQAALVYEDGLTLAVLANLGLSTQLAALGACLALGMPVVYLWLALGAAALLPVLQLRRERLVRRALAR